MFRRKRPALEAPPADATVPREGTLRLRDGRTLAYAEYGDPAGRPLFYFHGFPGSRLGAGFAHEHARRHRTRIIAFDRPGLGHSHFKRGRAITDWPADVLDAAAALGIDRFAVIGISGGGPYALACAAAIPERLTGVAVVSGVAPFDAPAAVAGLRRRDRIMFALGRRVPFLLRFSIWLFGRAARRSPDRTLRAVSRSAPPADKAAMARPEVWAALRDDLVEAFRQGSRGPAWEARLYLRPWGLRLDAITMPIELWQGEADTVVPPSMGRYLADTLPNCRPRFSPGEAHLLVTARLDEIHAALFP